MQAYTPDISNIPTIYTAIAMIMGTAVIIFSMPKRLGNIFSLGISLVTIFASYEIMLFSIGAREVFRFLFLLSALLMLSIYVLVTSKVKGPNVLYIVIRGFINGEFVSASSWLLFCWLSAKFNFNGIFMMSIFMLVYYVVAFIFFYTMEKKISYDYDKHPISWKIVIGTFVFSAICFFLGNSIHPSGDVPAEYQIAIYNTRTLMSLGTCAFLYTFHALLNQTNMVKETTELEVRMNSQYLQYEENRKNSEYINLKYHDLKNQLLILKQKSNAEQRKILDSMEQELEEHGQGFDCGNKALDTILDAKWKDCFAENITMTAVCEGEILDFMDEMDIYTLLGNILDNAIECERKLLDENKRIIHLVVAKQKNFVLIKAENYCEQKLHFHNGFPSSTKQDNANHGFGLKSIKYIVDKYQGVISMEQNNNWVELSILLHFVQKNDI